MVDHSHPDSVFVWSDEWVACLSEVLCSDFSSDSHDSVVSNSDRFGSSVENPPLVVLPWCEVLELESVLIVTN